MPERLNNYEVPAGNIEFPTDVEGLNCHLDRLHVKTPNFEGEMPILFFGNRSPNPKNLLILAPGIGAPTYIKDAKIHNYYSKVISSLLKRDPTLSIATIANWPNYQEDNMYIGSSIKSNTKDLYSIKTKKELLDLTTNFLLDSISPKNITIIGHSTSANVLIRNQSEFSNIRLIADGPSGIAKRSDTLILSENLAKKGLLSQIASIQKRILKPFIPMIAKSYGLKPKEFAKDSYLPQGFLAINTETLQKEINSESRIKELSTRINDSIKVIISENDPMIDTKDIMTKCDNINLIRGAGHLIHRQDSFIENWTDIIIDQIN